jgi:hypothetical protein
MIMAPSGQSGSEGLTFESAVEVVEGPGCEEAPALALDQPPHRKRVPL